MTAIFAESSSISSHWISGKRWQIAQVDNRAVMAMQQQTGLPEILCRLLVHRGVTAEGAEGYLNPSLKNLLPDPLTLKDMEKAVARLVQAIQAKETIGVFGDYDVDGATSSALLLHYFRWLDVPAAVHIPDRQKEGYGPNMFGLTRLKEQGAKLVITVDTGTLAHAVLAEAAEAGMEIIVVDHHQGEPTLPASLAVVNPNRFDEDSSEGHLAAVGVTFLLLVALHKKLKELSYFSPLPLGEVAERSDAGEGSPHPAHKSSQTSPNGRVYKEPDLRWLLDIVALGTVCDVVPLTGVNRAFVAQGLKILRQRQNIGLTALMDVAGLDEPPTPYHLGFLLGPRINAGGRVGLSDLGVKLLTAISREEAMPLAQQLDQFNKERKAIEANVLEQAMLQAERQQNAPMIFASGEGWHEGVIGIVAGRLKEQFNRPAAVIAWHEGKGKASARSVSGVDLGKVVIAARQQGFLTAGGGHKMAAGFSLLEASYEAFQQFVFGQIGADVGRYHAEYAGEVEGTLPCSAMTLELAALLEKAGPFGAGNPTPRLMVSPAKIIQADVLGTNHLRLIVTDASFGGRGQSTRLKVMGFGMAETPLGQALLNHRTQPVELIGRLKQESWQGRESVSLMLDDARFYA